MVNMKKLILFLNFNIIAFQSYEADKAYEKKDFEKAKNIYSQVIEKDPTNLSAVYNLGKVAYKQKDFEGAQKAFDVASKSENRAIAEKSYFNLGDSNIMLNRLQEALSNFESVLKINSDNKKAKERIEYIKKLLEQQKKEQEDKDKKDKEKKEQEQKEKEEKDKQKSQDNKSKKDSEDKKKQEQKEQDSKKESGSKESGQKDKGEQNQPDKGDKESKESSKDNNKPKPQHGDKESKESGDNKPQDSKTDQGQKNEQQDLKHKSDSQETKKGDNNTSQQDKAKQQKVQLPTKKGEGEGLKNLDETSKMILQAIEKNDADLRGALVSANVGKAEDGNEKNW